ncbi:MAG: 50S ribosomal protein L4 [Rhodothermales bacterium]|nr:50S ribosomal protein L4 [Rhodothermales bacterium]
MKVKVFGKDGKESKRSVTLEPAVFGVEPNDHAIWLDVRRIQANARQGTHKTKERNETAGSTRKLYRQKGTGHARAGDAKSPIRRSGGRTFGPRPRSYGLKVNKKTQRLARSSALAYKVQGEALRVVEDFGLEKPSAGELVSLLTAHDLAASKVLILTAGVRSALAQSAGNLKKVVVREATGVSTFDILNADVVLMQEGAVEDLTRVLVGNPEPTDA